MSSDTLTSWIDGERTLPESGIATTELVSPWSGRTAGTYQSAPTTVLERAISSAHNAFMEYRNKPKSDRINWLETATTEIENALDRIVNSEILFIGKPRRAARFEVHRSAQFVRACASYLAHFGGDTFPLDAAKAGAGLFGFTERIPYGVIAAVTPFNAPANLLLQKVAPALAVGNAVVVKPTPEGLEVALLLAECFAMAGLPPGLFNIVPGGSEQALAMASQRNVAFSSITGGTKAGQALASAAARKPFVGELGGNSPNIVCADSNLPDAVARIMPSAFEASGQQCISAQRIIVEETVIVG